MNEKPCANKHILFLKFKKKMVSVPHKGKRPIVSRGKKNCGGKNNSDFK